MYIKNNDCTLKLDTPLKHFRTYKGEILARKLLAIDVDYDMNQLVRIFSHGASNYKIWFLNRKKHLCVVDSAKIVDDRVCLTITLDVYKTKKVTHLTLDKFLYLVEIGDFVINNKKFNHWYMRPYFAANKFKV